MERNIRLAMGLSILGALQGAAAAAIPSEFTVQGVLRDGAGKLESQMVMVTLDFYDAQTVGTHLNAAAYGPTSAMATNGLFTQTVTLSAPDLTAIGAASAAWLQIQIGGDTYPRQKVEPEMFALFCQNATQLGGAPASSYLTTTTASSTYLTTTDASATYLTKSLAGTTYEPALAKTCTAGQFMNTVDGSGLITCASAGTVTSIAVASPLGTSNPSNGAIIGSGTISLSGTVPPGNGGTGIVSVGTAGNYLRSNGPGAGTWSSAAIRGADLPKIGAGTTTLASISHNGLFTISASCPASTNIISGNCVVFATLNLDKGGISLVNSYASSATTWECDYVNTAGDHSGADAWQASASANCL